MLKPTAEAWSGVNTFVDDYAEIESDDHVVVIFTDEGKDVAAWVASALKLRGIGTSTMWMAPFNDDGFTHRLMNVVPDPEAVTGNIIVIVFEVETLTHSEDIKKCLCQFEDDRTKIFRIMSSIPELFSSALRVGPHDLSALNTTILNPCMRAERLRVVCDGGTDLDIRLDNRKYTWVSNRGLWRPGSTIILPAGEVATFPADVNGVLVADVAFNINTMTDRDVRLGHRPVTVFIENGKAVSHECECHDTWQYIDECFKSGNGEIIGELGFGTNIGIMSAIPENSQINERFAGIHFGFGQHNQAERVEYFSERHIDLIANGGEIWVDDDPTPIDLGNLTMSEEEHPAIQAEDAFSAEGQVTEGDCCGRVMF